MFALMNNSSMSPARGEEERRKMVRCGGVEKEADKRRNDGGGEGWRR